MKAILAAVIWIDILACVWIVLQFPVIKMATPVAMAAIEKDFARPEFSEEDRERFKGLRYRIEGNEAATSGCLMNVRIGALVIGAVLLVQNLVLLSMLRREKTFLPGCQHPGPMAP